VDAQILFKKHLVLPHLPFGIRAPLAAQGAPLEEHQSPHAMPVMRVVFLDVENQGLSFNHDDIYRSSF
jgi:hypothetical protein